MELNDRIAPEIQNQLEGSVKYSVRYEISARSTAPGGIVVVTDEDVFVFENRRKFSKSSFHPLLKQIVKSYMAAAV